MKKVVAENKMEVEKYRRKLFNAKEAYRKEQAELPFERKIEIIMKLNRFAGEWGAGLTTAGPQKALNSEFLPKR